ncbi:MAG: SDR family oxidoreductase [Rhodoferax sp.]|jgi:retinol dehydrogenase-12|nr:SDR family oxidoreductase [Rhodoferax sp.]
MTTPSSHTLAGQVALVTGANTGIGLVTARELARRGAHVFVACRSLPRAQNAVQTIRAATGNTQVEALALDLGDFASVHQCAASFLTRGLPLHLLVNNAGLAGTRGFTASGFELAFGVNHMGHFLLTRLLLDRLRASAPARIVTVASRAHTRTDGIDWDALRKPTRTRTGIHEYAVSKLANVWFSAELGRRLAGSGVNTYALHPGVVASDVWRSVPWPFRSLIKLRMISTEEGAQTTLYCASDPACARETGLYYDKCRVRLPSALGQDANLARSLWERSEAWAA